MLRMLHYPPTRIEDNDFGTGPQTDNSFMTVLARDEVPGLAIRLPSDEWLEPPLLPGTFLVNIGNILRRMSNDRFLSTPHGRHRSMVAPTAIPCPISTARTWTGLSVSPRPAPMRTIPPKYPPVPYREHITEYSKANYFPSGTGFGKRRDQAPL